MTAVSTTATTAQDAQSTRIQNNHHYIEQSRAWLESVDFRSIPESQRPELRRLIQELGDAHLRLELYMVERGDLEL